MKTAGALGIFVAALIALGWACGGPVLPPVLPPPPCAPSDINCFGAESTPCPRTGDVVSIGEPEPRGHGCHVAPNGSVWSITAWKTVGFGVWRGDGGAP